MIHDVCPHSHDAIPKRCAKAEDERAKAIQCDYHVATDRPIAVAAPAEVPVLTRPKPEQTRLVREVA